MGRTASTGVIDTGVIDTGVIAAKAEASTRRPV